MKEVRTPISHGVEEEHSCTTLHDRSCSDPANNFGALDAVRMLVRGSFSRKRSLIAGLVAQVSVLHWGTSTFPHPHHLPSQPRLDGIDHKAFRYVGGSAMVNNYRCPIFFIYLACTNISSPATPDDRLRSQLAPPARTMTCWDFT